MTVSHKVSVSLFISVLLFAGFAVLAFTGLFDLVETRFYNPSITKGYERSVARDTEVSTAFLSTMTERFKAVLAESSVQRSFLPNQSAEDIFDRSRLFGLLMEETSGLQSVRFVDSAGKRIHFSTARADILKQDRLSMAYRSYGEAEGDRPFEEISVGENGESRIVFDQERDRFIFCYPFTDSFKVYKGTALFNLSSRALMERLVNEGCLKVGDDVALVGNPAGWVSGAPAKGRSTLLSSVSSIWKEGPTVAPHRVSSGEGPSLVLIAERSADGFYVGRLLPEGVFSFPQAMKIILLASFFCTVFLLVFLFFNLKQDSMTVIRERIKKLQISLVEEYYDRKGDLDWERWTRELEQRRDEVRFELKQNLRKVKNADELIDRSWDELIASIGGGRKSSLTAQIDEGKLEDILSRLLAAQPASAPRGGISLPSRPQPAMPVASTKIEADEVEDLEEVESVEDLEEIEEAEEMEPVGELDSGSLSAAPDGEAEDLEPLEEVEEIEAVEEIEVVEELEELPEELPEAGPASVLQEIRSVEAAPSPPPADAVEELEDLVELEEFDEDSSFSEVPVPVPPLAEKSVDAEPEAADNIGELEAWDEPLEELECVEGGDLGDLTRLNPDGYCRNAPNIRVVFGEDDIPYIVESSGIELVDDDLNSVMDFIDPIEKVEIEELDAVEGELEELGPDPGRHQGGNEEPVDGSRPSESELAAIVSAIEFSPSSSDKEEAPLFDFDVSSPFDTILGEFFSSIPAENEVSAEELVLDDSELESLEAASSDSGADDGDLPAELEAVDSLSLYTPFFSSPEEPGFLVSLGEGDEEIPSELLSMEHESESIVVKSGVAYIADSVLEVSASEGEKFDPELKGLVDSVLRR